jgi:hypothetical protein
MRIDDQILMAYADGELNAAARAEVERALWEDPALREQLEAQRKLKGLLSSRYDPVAEEEVPEHFRALIKGASESMVVDFAAARKRRSRPVWRNFVAIAATLAVGVLAGQLIPFGGTGSVAVEDGQMLAKGHLAQALETQLASAQQPDARTRIGISFAAEDGRVCRSFEAPEMAGLACREGEGWALVMTAAPAAAGGEYRQADAGPVLILEAAEAMMAGEPFDAVAERRARERSWAPDPSRRR